MSDKSGSSGSSGKRSANKISKPKIPKVVRKTEYDDDFMQIDDLDGWDEAQDLNKPKLKSINTDDRTGNPRVAEILEKLGWSEELLPETGRHIDSTKDSHYFGEGYRQGLVTDVARYAFELYPYETTDQIADRLKKKWGPDSSAFDMRVYPKKKESTKKKPKLKTQQQKKRAEYEYYKRKNRREKEKKKQSADDKKVSAKKKGGKRKRRKTRRKRRKSKRRKTRRKRRKSRKRKTRRRKR